MVSEMSRLRRTHVEPRTVQLMELGAHAACRGAQQGAGELLLNVHRGFS
jgi:hypothetical protein